MKKGLFIFTIILLFIACAQQNQPLSGGPKDTIPPHIIYSIPKLDDTSFHGNEIIIKFNEYFTLNNINAKFFSSPPFKEKPKFKIKGKKLILKINEKLKDSVTYFLNYGNSVQDFHEKNVLKKLTLFFSTYNKIDTLKASGKIIDSYSHKPVSDIYVMLYKKNTDSIPFKQTPIYVAKTDSSGLFTINNIKFHKYKIFALEDLNNNFIYNEDESNIAFSDSLVKPWVETKIQVDSLDSGAIFIDPKNTKITDTLRHDTVIKKTIYIFHPDSLKLLLFTEEDARQEIKRKVRDFKGLVKLSFTKTLIDNYIKISPLDPNDIKYFDLKKEEFNSHDSIYLWFTNPKFFDKDSLNFIAEYKINDSTLSSDTIKLTNYDFSTDTLPIEISSNKKNISNLSFFPLKSETPILSIDSSKINLYQIIDTIVEDEKKQLVKIIRPELDSLIFIFKRPIVKNFNIIFDNYSAKEIPFFWTKNNKNDSIFCKIKNQKLAQEDSLKFKYFYDNLYFFNQIQKLSSHAKIPVTEQKIISEKRIKQDSINILFNKNIPSNSSIKLLNFSKTDYIYQILNNKLEIILKNQKAINTDTLLIALSMIDRKLHNGLEKNYIDTIKAIYTFDKQSITYIRRYMRSRMIIAFKKHLLAPPKLKLLSFKPLRKWYSLKLNKTKDSVVVNISNQRVLRLNNMKLKIAFFDINQHKDTLFFADTITLKIKKLEKESSKILGREKKLTLFKDIRYKINQDTQDIRKYDVFAKYISGQKYKLTIDSAALKDIFSRTNDSISFNFKIFSPDDFSSISFQIKNIWAVLNDTASIDTNTFYQLPKGQIILQIEDKDGNVYKKIDFKTDKTFTDPMFLPGTYNLRIIYDENENGIWDTGNYIKHRQPEKVFIYTKTINLGEGDSQTIIWDLANPKDSK